MARGKSAEKAKILERQLQALEMRKNGSSFRAIGAKLGIDHSQAFRDVQMELKRLAALNQDAAAELRQLELERLDQMSQGVMRMANVGNPAAVLSMLKIMERRAKLLGLDMPTRVSIEGGVPLELINGLIKDIQNMGDGIDVTEEMTRLRELIAARKHE